MLQDRKTPMRTGEMAGMHIFPGLGDICQYFLNGWQPRRTAAMVPA